MRLYHTSDREIRIPDIHYGRKNADFGWGFYLSPDKDFIYRWAGKNAVVNEYELDTTGLEIHRFTRDLDWFRYIFDNRRTKDSLKADVIIGPIANDTIFDTMGILSSGLLEPEEAMDLLLIGPSYTQVAIKTEKAVRQLQWLRSERIVQMNEEERLAEQTAYQEALAAAMEGKSG